MLSVGVERFVPQEEARRGEGRGDRLPGHPGGGEDRRPEEGDDRVTAAAGEGALGPDDSGRSGEGEGTTCDALGDKLAADDSVVANPGLLPRLADAHPGRPAVPGEAEGHRPAGAGPAEPGSTAAAQAAGAGRHSSPQPTGGKHVHDEPTRM